MFDLKSLFSSPPGPTGPVEFLVVGLGNPGSQYDGTRHNVGFRALDYLAQQCACPVKKLKFQSLIGEATIAGRRVLLMKPSTFMNNSGQAVRDAIAFYKIPVEHVVVLCDDISLDPGKIRLRRKGSAGGHNGLKSIIYLTNSDAFPRIKIGVGAKPHPDYDLARWVLGRFSPEDDQKIQDRLPDIAKAVELIVDGNIERAMNQFN